MKRFHLVTAAAILAAGAWIPAASAQSPCASPRGSVEQRACAAAAQGPDALRRFVTRTRHIYALYYADFASPEW
jgi:hypothetical protein